MVELGPLKLRHLNSATPRVFPCLTTRENIIFTYEKLFK